MSNFTKFASKSKDTRFVLPKFGSTDCATQARATQAQWFLLSIEEFPLSLSLFQLPLVGRNLFQSRSSLH